MEKTFVLNNQIDSISEIIAPLIIDFIIIRNKIIGLI